MQMAAFDEATAVIAGQEDVAGDHTCDHEYPIVMSGSQLPGNE